MDNIKRIGITLLLATVIWSEEKTVSNAVDTVMQPVSTVSAQQQNELCLEGGRTQALWNGEKLAIARPYIHQKEMMVPLRVFTTVFGANVSWEQGDVVVLKQGERMIRFQRGQKQMWLNGKRVLLSVAPEMMQGKLMVPLQPFAKAFGASCATLMNNKRILTWKQSDWSTPDRIDLGKKASYIGDDYYHWSMLLPQGWTYEMVAPEEHTLVMRDTMGRAAVSIQVLDKSNLVGTDVAAKMEQSNEMLQWIDCLKHMNVMGKGEIIHTSKGKLDGFTYIQAIMEGKHAGAMAYKQLNPLFIQHMPPQSYQMLVRMFQENSKIYFIRIYADASIPVKAFVARYEDLLHTFQPVLPVAEKNWLNVSSVKNGERHVKLWRKGLSVDLPVTWKFDKKDKQRVVAVDDEQELKYFISEAEQGMTLDKLVSKQQSLLKQIYKPTCYRVETVKPVTLHNGIPARLITATFTLDQTVWWTNMHLLVLDAGVQYVITYEGQDIEQNRVTGERILRSVNVDGTEKNKQGQVSTLFSGKEWFIDWNKKVYRNALYDGFTIQIPYWWTVPCYTFSQENYDQQLEETLVARYHLPHSFIYIFVEQLPTLRQWLAEWEEKLSASYYNIRTITKKKMTWQGYPAYELQLLGTENRIDTVYYTIKLRCIIRDGYVYTMMYQVCDRALTPHLLRDIQQTMDSFQFRAKNNK